MGRALATGIKVTTALGVIAALGGGVWFGSQRVLRSSAERELGAAWAAFAQCTLGDTPLEGDAPSVRFRAIQLGASGTDWPNRCAVYEGHLFNAAHRAARFGVVAFEDDVPRADTFTDTALYDVSTELLDRLYKDAASLPKGPYDVHTVRLPPPAAPLVRLAKLSPLGAGPVLASDPIIAGDLRLLFADRVCWLRASDHLAFATCTPVAPDASTERVLAGAEDGAPPLVLPRGDSGWVREDGTSYVLGQGDPYALAITSADGKRRAPFGRPPGDNVAAIQLAGDSLLWTMGTTTDPWAGMYGEGYTPPSGFYSVNTYARTLGANGQLGATADLGAPWGGDVATVSVGCRSEDATFLQTREALLTHRKALGWGGFQGTPRGIEPVADSLSCLHGEAMVVGLTDASLGAPSVQQTRCSYSGCSVATVGLDVGWTSAVVTHDLSAIAAVGEPIVIAREANGLRLRVGRLTDLPTVPDRLLLDGDPAQPGSEHVSRLWLYGRAELAVLVVQADKGTFAFTVDGTGKATPVSPR